MGARDKGYAGRLTYSNRYADMERIAGELETIGNVSEDQGQVERSMFFKGGSTAIRALLKEAMDGTEPAMLLGERWVCMTGEE